MAPRRLYEHPTEQLARLMMEARDEGLGFDEAWQRAVRPGLPLVMSNTRNPPAGAIRWPTDRTDRIACQDAIAATREGWRRAYVRRPETAPERAVAYLASAFGALDTLAEQRARSEGIRHLEAVRSAA